MIGCNYEEEENHGRAREGRLLHTLFMYGGSCLLFGGFGLLDSFGLHASQKGN